MIPHSFEKKKHVLITKEEGRVFRKTNQSMHNKKIIYI